MIVFLTLLAVAAVAGLFYNGFALWEGLRKLDTNALQAQVNSGTPIDISQVRALETRLLGAIQAAQFRENKKDDAFKNYLSALYNKLTDLGAAYTTLMDAYKAVEAGDAPAVDPEAGQDYSADYDMLMQSIITAQSLGLGQIADLPVPPGIPAMPTIVPPADPTAFPDIDTTADPTADPAPDPATGSIIGATEAADAADAAKEQAEQQAATPDKSAAVAIPPGATFDTHPETGAVTVTLPPGTVIVQGDAPEADSDAGDAAPVSDQQGGFGDAGGQSGAEGEQAA